jgi:hypothetical protein
MLLIITETGDASIKSDLSEDDVEAFDAGIIDVFDVGGKPIKRLLTGMQWEDVIFKEEI